MDKDQVISVMKKNAGSIAMGVLAVAAVAVIFLVVNPMFAGLQERLQASAGQGEQLADIGRRSRPNLSTSLEGGEATLAGFPTPATIEAGRRFNDAIVGQADGVLNEVTLRNRRLPLRYAPADATPAAFEAAFAQAAAEWPLEGQDKLSLRNLWLLAYKQSINADGAFDEETGDYPQGTLQRAAQSTRPPTAEDLNLAQERRTARLRAEAPKNPDGQPMDPEGLERQVAQAVTELSRNLKYTRAVDHLLYLDASDGRRGLSVHPVADLPNSPSAVECFEAQVQLWVQEEVVRNLVRANLEAVADLPEDRRNVINAPVKHLVRLDVPATFVSGGPLGTQSAAAGGAAGGSGGAAADMPPDAMYNPYGGYNPYAPDAGGGAGAAPDASRAPRGAAPAPGRPSRPAADDAGRPTRGGIAGRSGPAAEEDQAPTTLTEVPVDPAAEIETEYQYSPSGRTPHTPFYDAVQFTLTLRVEAQSVPEVLRQLQRGSFLTVLNVFRVTAVDPVVALQEGYVYGDAPVVEMTLQCELLLLRNWTVDFMPEQIRQELQAWAASNTAE